MLAKLTSRSKRTLRCFHFDWIFTGFLPAKLTVCGLAALAISAVTYATTRYAAAPGVVTVGLEGGSVGRPYSSQILVKGGAPPYHWSIPSGGLPHALSLNPSDGRISGTPDSAVQYSFVVSVTDSNGAVATRAYSGAIFPAQDAYGGLPSLPCPEGAKPRFYVEPFDNQWHLCTPAGNAFFMLAVYNASYADTGTDYQGVVLQDLVAAKYADGPVPGTWQINWAMNTARRLQGWGFNSLAEYNVHWINPSYETSGQGTEWTTSDHTIPIKLPYVWYEEPSYYSLCNADAKAPQAAKDLERGVKNRTYTGYRTTQVDPFDPNWARWFSAELATQNISGVRHLEDVIGVNVDDEDYVPLAGAGVDFPTVSNDAIAPGHSQPNIAWITLVTAPTQASNPSPACGSAPVTYSDSIVYAKRALADFLSNKYGGNVALLNAAWKSNYTAFNSAGGWGTGSGLLDEDGSCPAKRMLSSCWVGSDPFALAGETPEMQSDLNAFLREMAAQYFSAIKTALNRYFSPAPLYMGPTTLGSWSTPPRREVLQAAAASVDVVVVPSLPMECSNCNDLQRRMDFYTQYAGNKPWISWIGFAADADSYMARFAHSNDALKTQSQRGQLYRRLLQSMLAAHDTGSASRHFVGLKWWSLYDSRGEQTNWGLITNRDDPYDGVSSSPHPGTDPWGYPTGCVARFGCEAVRYGDFLGPVTAANFEAVMAAGHR